MKQDLTNDVVQGMLPFLNNAQSEKMQEVFQYSLAKYEVTEDQGNKKSLAYYKATIEAMLGELQREAKHIVTDDIRRYLTEYQKNLFQ